MLYTLVFISSITTVVVPNLPSRASCDAAARQVAAVTVPAVAQAGAGDSQPGHACIETVDPRH